jgi:hypothetical protein
MFKYKLHEDTKYYLKSLLVEDDASPTKDKKDTKKSKGKKEDAVKAAEPKPVPPPTPPVDVSGSPVSPTEEEKKKIEADQKRAQEEEISKRTLPLDRKTDLEKNKIDPTYKENVRQSSGGPSSADSGKRDPYYTYGASSGRGRGAPAPEEPADRTGIQGMHVEVDGKKLSRSYNFPVLLGQSFQNVKSVGTAEDPLSIITSPYKDLQNIKLVKAHLPGILGKIKAMGEVDKATLKNDYEIGSEPYKAPEKWTGTKDTKEEKITELIDSGFVPSNEKQKLLDSDDTIINALYGVVKKDVDFNLNKQNAASSFAGKVQTFSKKLKGLGGLDPFFGEELAAKLLGGEWIEKTMQNIAPAQERGVISSMGNRSSIGM